MEMAAKGKAKRRHLCAGECSELGQNLGGPLVQPFGAARRSLDPSRGLYPRSPSKRGRKGVENSSPQKPITQFFPVKGILSTSPQKAVKEEEPNREAELQEADDDPFAGLTESMFMDDEELAVKQEEFPGPFSVKQEGMPGSFSVKQEELPGPFSVKQEFPGSFSMEVRQGGTAGCSSWDYQPPPNPAGPVCVKVEKEDDDEYPVDPLPDAHYGLLGSRGGWAEPQGQLGDLPEEILGAVVPDLSGTRPGALEDMRTVPDVCRWSYGGACFSLPLQFVPWKKLYYQYQREEPSAVQFVDSILEDNCITAREELCILNMVKYVSQFKHSRTVQPEEVLRCVREHPLFPAVHACLKHRLPELPEIQGGPNPWSAMALILILANGVKDVQDLVIRLRRSGCLQSPGGVSEYLCCVAVLLLAMRRHGIKMSSRCHYNVFYVLHLMENAPRPAVAAQSGLAIQVTHEQQQILNHDIQPGQIVKVMAFAGTGKTSTLVQYAQQRPHLRFLYVAFNKSTATEARGRFSRNVDCRTVHSMAFAAIGKRYQNLKKLSSNLRPFCVAWVLPKGMGGFVNAKVVTQTIGAFFASADRHITVDHVPQEYKNTNGQMKRPDHTEKQAFVYEAQKIWDRMTELTKTKETAYHMTHDGYLKLWQLQNPRLYNYDAIFIDEAQDCTPAVMDILLHQSCGKILVGDPHQQIYTFRGAVNALQEASHTHLYYLTQSFRFGSEISYIGATILWFFKGVTKMLVGGSQEGSVRGEEDPSEALGQGQARAHREGTVAILSRCNVTVFDQAVRLTSPTSPPKIHIVGGVENFGLKKILDIWVLMQPESDRIQKNLSIGDYFIRRFCSQSLGGYAGLKRYACNTEDRELEAKLAVVEKYGHRIPELVDRICSCSVSTPHSADYVLGTVHKAKGQEFDTVFITDDFAKVHCAGHTRQRLFGTARREDGSINVPEDEWNLLYVAVTRAKKKLVITKTIGNILTMAKEYFLRPVLTSTLLGDGQPPCCSVQECHNRILEDSALTMCKVPIRYSDSAEAGGPLCVTCVEQRVGHMAYLIASPEQVKATPYTLERVEFPINVAMLMALF
ncbi:F-box DNA helicase 1 [Anguilla rostrata]|uniref:F-box DNA helicase 1 n=1 Tax=Anguilla rostrata TaxID=7938 RepID=UPI0030D5CE01